MFLEGSPQRQRQRLRAATGPHARLDAFLLSLAAGFELRDTSLTGLRRLVAKR